MADDKSKKIPIEDGNAEEEKKAGAKEKAEAEAKKLREELEREKKKREKAAKKEKEAEEPDEAETAGVGEGEEEKSEKSEEAEESERYMRLMAEFQNFKRRAAKEKTDIHAYANERIVGDLLPVLDNFERALDTASEDAEGVSEELSNYAKGMQLIFEQLKTALENAGLKEIEALGCDFDPNVHNAVMTENLEEFDNDKISKVLQKGYKLNDKVVRPSMVAVNKK